MSAANQHGSLEKSPLGTAHCFHGWGPPRVKGPLCDGRGPGELEGVWVGHEPLDHTHPSGCLPPPSLLPKTSGATLIGGCPRPGVGGDVCTQSRSLRVAPRSVWLGVACRWVVCVCAHVCARTHVHACVCLCVGGTCVCTHAWVRTHAWVWDTHMYWCTCVCAHTHTCVCGRAWLWWEGENDLKHTPKTPPLTIWHVRAGPEIGTDRAKIRRLHAGWAGHGGAVLSTQDAALLAGAEPHWGHRLAGLQRKTFSTSGKPGN